jgi:hypothetical protein
LLPVQLAKPQRMPGPEEFPMTRKTQTILTAFLLALPGPLAAATLFQSIPDLASTSPAGNICSDCNNGQQAFDKFMLSNGSIVSGVSFVVNGDSLATSTNFNIQIYNSANILITNQSFVSSSAASTPAPAGSIIVSVPLLPTFIAPGNYTFSAFGVPTFAPVFYANLAGELSSGVAGQPGLATRFESTGSRFSLGFAIEGDEVRTLPVPGPIAGAGVPALFGLAGAWFVRRRKQRLAA